MGMTQHSWARGLLVKSSAEIVTINSPKGDAPGVVLKLEESDAAGKIDLHQFIVPAQAFNALLSMLHDVRTALTGQPAATPGEKMTVRSVLANMQTDVRAFMLTLETKDGAGTITANQFVMQPAQMQGLCSLAQETLRDEGHAVPALPAIADSSKH
jgi:predicted thioesterase